jgi:hypothetical protein
MKFNSDYFQLNCIFAKNKQQLKKIIVILLLLVFSLRPVYYLGCLGYYGLNINTIIEKYCVNKGMPELNCDGKCYLAQQLNKASDSDENNSNKLLNVIHETFIPVYITYHTDIKFHNFSAQPSIKKIFGHHNNYTFLPEFNNFKPPIS